MVLKESLEDDANRLLDEIESLSGDVFSRLSKMTQSEDVLVDLQYNTESFSKAEMIRSYLSKINDFIYDIEDSAKEEY